MQPLLVLADTYQQACDYARQHGLGRDGGRWRYVREARQVRGRRDGRYVLLTIPRHQLGRRDSIERLEILAILRYAGFTAVDGS
jgi:hypothetical protein